MKHLRIFGFAVFVALMACAGTASATTLTSPAGTTYTSTIKAESAGATSLDGAFPTVTCNKSTVEGKVEFHGSSVTAGGKLSSLTFTECNYPTTVQIAGSLEVHGAGSGNGTVTSNSAKVTIATGVGTCVFTTAQTDVGTLTGSNASNAWLHIASSKIPRTEGNFLCGSFGTWTGAYKITTPSTLSVD